jgi:hypothetical protein
VHPIKEIESQPLNILCGKLRLRKIQIILWPHAMIFSDPAGPGRGAVTVTVGT